MYLLSLIYTLIGVAIAQNVFTTGTCVTSRGCGAFPTASRTPPTTITNTIQLTLTRIVTVCPTATVFVFNSTSTTTGTQTVNSTVVSALRVTETSTVTTNVTSTDTEEATTTVTSTSTVTLTATIRRTSTIPATAGFVPIASEPGYVPRRRNKRGDDKLVPTAQPALEKRCWPDIQAVVCNTTMFTLTAQTVTRVRCRTPLPTITVTRNVTANTATATVTTTVISTRTESLSIGIRHSLRPQLSLLQRHTLHVKRITSSIQRTEDISSGKSTTVVQEIRSKWELQHGMLTNAV
ncbi:hypothetical protein FOIG_06460 [Fusarium odoratissimum NRRL 54006]|uniref:Uncharacterized protein n=1 Tax=Fusarium odoratissimum (strain NRRL 54006) TaxID=1089451 RepID=X0JLS7_FUSO5|nr:uncharacterized protein FOIG_06460 [Fusarium odoratissimum NRRL 54006]EXM02173.1 hypothetical protein FOIG_06460 [Fusarium odoratissimum NRRL 54006]